MDKLKNAKKAAKIHKQVRNDIRDSIKPNIKLWDICESIENRVRELSDPNEINGGVAFPTGCSLNNIAAHFTPNKTDTTILTENDVCKIDFGVHVNGYIIDSAFTVAFNDKYDPLLEASREAVKGVIKNMGVDSKVSELGEISEEIVRSYEVDMGDRIRPLKPIDNLFGHSIDRWNIHAGKFIPGVKNDRSDIISEDEFYAVEIFPTTGKGTSYIEGESTHFMLKPNYKPTKFNIKRSSVLLSKIEKEYKSLAFCPRFLNYWDRKNQQKETNYSMCLPELFNKQIINSYPPLLDIPGSMVSQFEHTVFIGKNSKIILSEGEDY
jgi:methionyl aminopeptidase